MHTYLTKKKDYSTFLGIMESLVGLPLNDAPDDVVLKI